MIGREARQHRDDGTVKDAILKYSGKRARTYRMFSSAWRNRGRDTPVVVQFLITATPHSFFTSTGVGEKEQREGWAENLGNSRRIKLGKARMRDDNLFLI